MNEFEFVNKGNEMCCNCKLVINEKGKMAIYIFTSFNVLTSGYAGQQHCIVVCVDLNNLFNNKYFSLFGVFYSLPV